MATRKENLKALFTNTRTRVIIAFTAVVLLIAILIGAFRLFGGATTDSSSGSRVSYAPGGIRSIPGSEDPSAQYAALVQKQNVEQAQQAAKKGGSSIPTIIRTQAFGKGIESVGPKEGKGGVGFQTLAQEEGTGPTQSLWIQNLKDANCSQSSMQKVLNQGATLTDVKAACSCTQLRDNGYKLSDLNQVCSCSELKTAGFNAVQLKNAGYTATRLKRCGFNACQLRAAGFNAQQLKDAGFTDGELRGAGFSPEEIARASGLPAGVTADDVRQAGCSPADLEKLREEGVSAAAIRRISGCSASQLKAAEFTAGQLKNAGFSAADLKKAGFTPAQLQQAGYSARDLLNAGFTPDQLSQAGFTPEEIKSGESELPPGMSPEDVKESGCNVEALKREKAAGVSAKLIRQMVGCSASALKKAGFTDQDLANAGFTPQQINAAQSVGDNGIQVANQVSDQAVKAAGCAPSRLKALREKGVSAQRIRELNGCSAEALKAAGFDAKSLANAGFTPKQLLDAGFTPQQLSQAGLSPSGAIASGRTADCSTASLQAAHAMGVSAATIKQTLGCSAKALKDAGYTASELRNAGFTAGELKNAGFSAKQLKNAGFTAKQLKDAGFTAAQLKNAGFTAGQLQDAGFNAGQLKDAGFNAQQLKNAGFNASELKNAGFSANQLKAAGFSAKDLKDAGFSANQLRQAGFGAGELKNAGFSAAQLKQAGFSNQQLQNAGFPASEIAGLSPEQQPATPPSDVTPLPGVPGAASSAQGDQRDTTNQLQAILKRQQGQMASQQYQQKLQQRISAMQSAANQTLQEWKTVSTQTYIAGTPPKEDKKESGATGTGGEPNQNGVDPAGANRRKKALIRTGDVMFAILDTSINSDEPGPILATMVSGKYKGSKLIGNFHLGNNADKLVINFNTMSVPSAPSTTSINAYAIDPNTARTALASSTNHHYLFRYGSLFASTFLEGFGNAFQSANTTITIGGNEGLQQTTIQNGVGRSILENAVIGLATLGKNWGQVAQQQFNRPTTVRVCAGTSLGILFTQDVTSL